MPVQTLPRSAEVYQRAQQREVATAVVAARALWRRMGTEFDVSYAGIESALVGAVEQAQARVAVGALVYVPAVLEETGQRRAVVAIADEVPEAFVGVAGDGRPVRGLMAGAVVHTKQRVAAGLTPPQALTAGGKWLTMAVGTVLSDTGRAAEAVAMAVRPVGGYVRMLNPPSCSRCAILAGRVYMDSQAFLRHPQCDCRHIPASESIGEDLTVDGRSYFDSLDPAEQGRIFTSAGAEAIREGADINQVVNARRGMRPAQVGGRSILTTTEGTTRRGFAYGRLTTGSDVRRPRLMPETIRAVSTDKADYLRLLRANGYIR